MVKAGERVVDDLGISAVAVIGRAKCLEEVGVPAEPDPLIMPRNSEGLYLLQRVRDEAHRTAISFHRKRRGKRATTSALDGIPGLGPAKAKALLKQFGSVRRITAASPAELTEVAGIGPVLAETIHAALSPQSPQ